MVQTRIYIYILQEEMIAMTAFTAVIEDGALASSSVKFTHESTVDFFK
jgi:hypothetical protein